MAKKTVTKNDLIQTVMENSDLNRNDANFFLESFFDIIIKSLEEGQAVKISGFGNFILRQKKARMGRNPKTKEEFLIEERQVVSFHTSNCLKDMIKDTYS